jgi:glycosidase
MPDLNQKNPLVLNYLAKCHWWIEYADLDGFRVDTYNYADPLVLIPD